MQFENKNNEYKCVKCGYECKHLATALDHRDYYGYDGKFGCGGDIATHETIHMVSD